MTTAHDIVLGFDTTGSMLPVATEVRHNLHRSVGELFARLPNIRVGMLAIRDYDDADRPDSYVTSILPFKGTADGGEIQAWISTHKARDPRGDAPEAYELALREVR